MKSFIRRGLFFTVSIASLAIFPSGCGSDTPESITLTGSLEGSRGVLAGYKFKCVTLTNPAFSGVATADANGAFSLAFSAAEVPFGCFVLDTNDAQVATTFFTSSTENNAVSQTILIAGTSSVGTVTVDSSRGKATATIAAATKKGADGLECPVGVWKGTVGVNAAPCGGETVTLTLWIGKDSAGTYTVSQALDPVAPATCGLSTFVPTAGTFTFANSKVNYSVTFGHPIPHASTATIDVSPDCNEMYLKMKQTGCVSCSPTPGIMVACQGSGGAECGDSDVWTLTKQK